MRIYRYTADQLPNVVLPIGVQNENDAREIRIDYTAWVPAGVPAYPHLVVLMPNGTEYIPEYLDREDEIEEGGSDTVLVWRLKAADTSVSGNGLARLVVLDINGTVIKSEAARTRCIPSALAGSSDQPELFDEWLQRLTDKANSITATWAEVRRTSGTVTTAVEACRAFIEAAKADVPGVADGIMNLATTMEINLAVADWEAATGGGYDASVSNAVVTSDTAATLMLDETSAAHAQACIRMDTSAGTIAFHTATLPTGTLTGTLILNGRFAQEDEEAAP